MQNKMKAQDYYFKGKTFLDVKTDAATSFKFVDDKNSEVHIRIVGTKNEITILAEEFQNKHKWLILDEVYNYEVPKKDNHWFEHHCFGTPKEYKKIMKKISSDIKEYKKKYIKGGSFIVN